MLRLWKENVKINNLIGKISNLKCLYNEILTNKKENKPKLKEL